MRKQFDFHNCFHRTIKVKTESNYLLWGNCEINLKKKQILLLRDILIVGDQGKSYTQLDFGLGYLLSREKFEKDI